MSCRPPRSWAIASTGVTSARTSARGTRAPTGAPRGSSRTSSTTPSRRSTSGSSPTPTTSPTATGGSTCPTATAAGSPETRVSRSPTSAKGHRADPAQQLLRRLSHLRADGLGLDHLGLAAVAQDLRDEPLARAVGDVGDGRSATGRLGTGAPLELPARALGREPDPGDADRAAERVVEIGHLGPGLVVPARQPRLL